jgi:penicillin-insensitive murein endopeptidase
VSHQSGRDVDIGYFYLRSERWYRRGTAANLDIPKNWAFVRALVTETDVELILIDISIQQLLRDHALKRGEDPRWVKSLFSGDGNQRPLIRHARGHATHLHVRFYNPVAQETARRAYSALVQRGIVPPVQNFISHRARRGDTLGKLSKKYGVSVPAIRRANRLKNNRILERRNYLIPVARPRPAPPARRLSFPPRRLPPSRTTPPESAPVAGG